jgi:hypothetical protein
MGQIQRQGWAAPALPTISTNPVDGHPPEPGPERALAAAVKLSNLADNDDEHLLGDVGGFVFQAWDTPEPALNQRQIDRNAIPAFS